MSPSIRIAKGVELRRDSNRRKNVLYTARTLPRQASLSATVIT